MSTSASPLFVGSPRDAAILVSDYQETRRTTENICAPLEIEDHVIQAMPDASPPKWHLGHVSWFFETVLLMPHLPEYQPLNPKYQYLFNSYYNTLGPQFYRPHRGHLSRPTVAEVYEFRAHVDRSMLDLIETTDPRELEAVGSRIILGLNHEEQHQELLMADIKYNLSVNPLRPAYLERKLPHAKAALPLSWVECTGGVLSIGHDRNGFAFDNEWPRHETYIRPYRLASRLVTNGQYLEFMEAGGYESWEFWLSEGWKAAQERHWKAPLYWERVDGEWWTYTLSGMQPLDPHAPVAHVSTRAWSNRKRDCGYSAKGHEGPGRMKVRPTDDHGSPEQREHPPYNPEREPHQSPPQGVGRISICRGLYIENLPIRVQQPSFAPRRQWKFCRFNNVDAAAINRLHQPTGPCSLVPIAAAGHNPGNAR